MAVAIVTDSTHHLPPELIAAHGIQIVSLYVNCGDALQRESELADYYERLRGESGAATPPLSVPPPARTSPRSSPRRADEHQRGDDGRPPSSGAYPFAGAASGGLLPCAVRGGSFGGGSGSSGGSLTGGPSGSSP